MDLFSLFVKGGRKVGGVWCCPVSDHVRILLGILTFKFWSNGKIAGHSKLYPLKTRYVATQFVHILLFTFLELEIDTIHCYVTTRTQLYGYAAVQLCGYVAIQRTW